MLRGLSAELLGEVESHELRMNLKFVVKTVPDRRPSDKR